jgi:hypothetical protein
MASSAFVRLSHEEICDLHAQAANFVETQMRTAASPSMKLAPLGQCTVGRTHLTAPIYGTNSVNKSLELFQQLKDMFGVDVNGESPTIHDEIMPDGSGIVYKLNLPILFQRKANNRGGGSGGVSSATPRSMPSLEWPLFLLIVDAGLAGYLYYRQVSGTAF